MFVLYVDEYKDGKKLYQEAVRITGEETVPQIFIDETYLGGYSKLRMLHERRYVHELLLPNARNVEKRKRKKEEVLKEFSSLVNIDSPDVCMLPLYTIHYIMQSIQYTLYMVHVYCIFLYIIYVLVYYTSICNILGIHLAVPMNGKTHINYNSRYL